MILSGKKEENGDKIVIATVHGDIHDIGKTSLRFCFQTTALTLSTWAKTFPRKKCSERCRKTT